MIYQRKGSRVHCYLNSGQQNILGERFSWDSWKLNPMPFAVLAFFRFYRNKFMTTWDVQTIEFVIFSWDGDVLKILLEMQIF